MRQRIVYVSATDELGGADASLFELVRSLDRDRCDPHVVVPHDGPYADRYRRLIVPVHVVPLKKLKNTRDLRWHAAWLAKAPLRIWRLLRLFARLRPDVVHVNTSVESLAGLAAAWYCRRHACKLVWHVRELELRPKPIERALFGLVRRCADRVIAISTPVAARIGPREHVYVIPNGLDLARFAPGEQVGRRPADSLAAPTIGWVGRIAPGKGLDHVLELFGRLAAERPVRLVVMGAEVSGHGAYAAALRAATTPFGERVQWLPAGPDPERAYAQLDLFVHLPDVAEGLGRTVLEAQAAGVPVVAWPRGGLVDALQDGVTGCFAPTGDLAATAALVRELLEDPARRAAMSIAARAFATERFGRDRCARAVEHVYAEVGR